MAQPETAIEIEGLRRTFGVTTALDGVSLTTPAGQVLGLLGPNGAGKTTLVRILATLLAPTAGTARVLGCDVVKDAARLRGMIGLTGQVATVDELLTGRENLEMIAGLYHLPRSRARQRATELLELFGLTDAAGRRSGTYSGGMRRRLDLAASLIASPPVVFLDEPTTGLDPASRLAMWAAVEQLAEAGTTVLLTTQYLEEADRLAHRIVVIDHGRLIAAGTPGELKADLRGELVEFRVTDPAQRDHALRAIATEGRAAPGTGREGQRITLPAPAGAATLRTVLRLLDDAGIAIDDAALRHPTLDEVFLALTGHPVARGGGGAPVGTDDSPVTARSTL
ncbi:MAG: ATP-binding cassette domain-containing protein [Trebonia sp.]